MLSVTRVEPLSSCMPVNESVGVGSESTNVPTRRSTTSLGTFVLSTSALASRVPGALSTRDNRPSARTGDAIASVVAGAAAVTSACVNTAADNTAGATGGGGGIGTRGRRVVSTRGGSDIRYGPPGLGPAPPPLPPKLPPPPPPPVAGRSGTRTSKCRCTTRRASRAGSVIARYTSSRSASVANVSDAFTKPLVLVTSVNSSDLRAPADAATRKSSRTTTRCG